jgi:hypothetical protein
MRVLGYKELRDRGVFRVRGGMLISKPPPLKNFNLLRFFDIKIPTRGKQPGVKNFGRKKK